jgi:hypothetical protein
MSIGLKIFGRPPHNKEQKRGGVSDKGGNEREKAVGSILHAVEENEVDLLQQRGIH